MVCAWVSLRGRCDTMITFSSPVGKVKVNLTNRIAPKKTSIRQLTSDVCC